MLDKLNKDKLILVLVVAAVKVVMLTQRRAR